MKTIIATMLGTNIKRLTMGLVLAATMATGAVETQPTAHAGGVSPVVYQLPCWFFSGNQQITLGTDTSVGVFGKCFRGSTAEVIVWDATKGSYLNGGWVTTPVNGDGTFYYSAGGANCYDNVDVLAYDPTDGTYTNHANWTLGYISCPPR